MKIKEIEDKDVLSIKENHVLNCFTDYLYHKHASDQIQEELTWIASELSSGSTSNSIIKVSKDKGSCTPWENELLAREYELIKEQNKHEEAMEVVDQWLANIKNENHRKIIIEYLINNFGDNTEEVGEGCCTSQSNVCKVSKRIITNIARRLK